MFLCFPRSKALIVSDHATPTLLKSATPCYAWSLLGNHAYFLLRTGEIPLAGVMRKVLTGYAVTFNRRYRPSGHLFQNRYQSILCEEAGYLRELVRYFGQTEREAKRGYVRCVSEGAGQGGRPALVGGGLFRSVGGWKGLKEMRDWGEKVRGDERILGGPEFVGRVLRQSQEQWERRAVLRISESAHRR